MKLNLSPVKLTRCEGRGYFLRAPREPWDWDVDLVRIDCPGCPDCKPRKKGIAMSLTEEEKKILLREEGGQIDRRLSPEEVEELYRIAEERGLLVSFTRTCQKCGASFKALLQEVTLCQRCDVEVNPLLDAP